MKAFQPGASFSSILLALLGLLPLLSTPASGQKPTPLNFAYSYSVFALDDTSSLLELDYQYSDRGLVYQNVGGESVGRLIVRLRIWDRSGRPVLGTNWLTSNRQPEGTEENVLLGNKVFSLKPGEYRAQVYYEDLADSTRHDSSDFSLAVRSFAGERLGLSDVQVVSEASPSEETGHGFYKGGYIVYPNVLASIEPPILLLSTYLEIYNADKSPSSQVELVYGIADSTGKLIYQKEERRDRPTGRASSQLNSIVLDELASGNYFLVVKAYNGLSGAANDSAMVARPFSVYNPDADARAGAQAASSIEGSVDPYFSGMNEEELDREFQSVHVLAQPKEVELWKEITGAEAKARYMSAFWQRRDPTPGTPANEFQEDYRKRLETVNALYVEPLNDYGWQSDRGRVLLQYGRPDQIDRRYYEKNRKPHEIWTYSKGNLTFVFVDRTEQGKFLLVHSTAPGEIANENWETMYATIHQYLDN